MPNQKGKTTKIKTNSTVAESINEKYTQQKKTLSKRKWKLTLKVQIMVLVDSL